MNKSSSDLSQEISRSNSNLTINSQINQEKKYTLQGLISKIKQPEPTTIGNSFVDLSEVFLNQDQKYIYFL